MVGLVSKSILLLGLVLAFTFTRPVVVDQSALSPTPFPFEEITIPYLRQRNYQSQFSDLQFTYKGSNYTAYLASFDSDGFKINGLLTKPDSDRPENGWPAIIFIHGYIPPSTYSTLDNYYDYVDYLAENGFIVFKIDLRGHASSEGEASGAYYSSDYIIDVLNAYSALEKLTFVNPSSIGLWGHSMAGNIVLRTLASKPQIPAGVIWAGAVYTYEDMQEFGINDNSYSPASLTSQRQRRRQQLREKYGDFNNDSSFWRQIAATNYLSDIDSAIQINHAIDDEVVNIGYSRNLNALLDKTNISHELNEYPGGGHNISGASFRAAMENTVRFFQDNL